MKMTAWTPALEHRTLYFMVRPLWHFIKTVAIYDLVQQLFFILIEYCYMKEYTCTTNWIGIIWKCVIGVPCCKRDYCIVSVLAKMYMRSIVGMCCVDIIYSNNSFICMLCVYVQASVLSICLNMYSYKCVYHKMLDTNIYD